MTPAEAALYLRNMVHLQPVGHKCDECLALVAGAAALEREADTRREYDEMCAKWHAAVTERDALKAEVERLRGEIGVLADSVRANQPNLKAYQERNRELQADVARLTEALKTCAHMLDRVFHPEKFEEVRRWFHGDGPYEDYVRELHDEGESVLDAARRALEDK